MAELKEWMYLPVLACSILACPQAKAGSVELASSFQGADGGGNTVPGAQLPFGFVSLSPDTSNGSTSRHNSGGRILGFSHTRVSGTSGAGNLAFARAAEQANPGFYSVMLGAGEKQIGVKLTASRLAGFHCYRFPGNPEARIILNASATIRLGGGGPRATGGQRTVVDATHVAGQITFAGGWGQAKPYKLYFHALFDRPAREVGRWQSSRGEFRKLVGEGTTTGGDSRSGLDNQLGAFATFDTRENPFVQLKLAVSFISVEQARRNVEREPGWSFEARPSSAARSENAG